MYGGIGALDDLSLFMGDDALMGGWSTGGDSLDDPRNAFLQRTAAIESSYNRAAVNPLSGATGLFQFLPDTWRGVMRNYPDLGLAESDIGNNEKQALAANALLDREILPALRKALGREPTQQEVYTAWGLGTPDARKLFNAVKENPDALAPPLFRPKVSEWNKNIFFHDKEGTQPRTVSEVAQAYANLWNGAKNAPPKGSPMQPEYDPENSTAGVAARGIMQMMQQQPQGGAGVSQMQAPPQRVGLSGLDPYLKIAAQLMPERQGSGWGDALINAGAAMMQSRSPDFLGAAGAGLAAGNQALQARRGQDRQDVLDRFKFGMGLAQFDQKDAGEWAVNDGVMFNKKTGETRDVPAGLKPFTEAAKLRADLAAGRIKQDDFDAGMAKIRGEGESPIERVIREMGIDPKSPQAQELRMEYAKRMGGTQVNVNNTPETEFGKKLAGIKADVVEGARTGATSAMQTLEAVNRMSSVMNEGLKTGTFAPARDAFARFALDVGVPQTAVDQFFNTKDAKVFEAAAKEMVLGIVKTLGPNPSNADREFIEKTLPNLRDPTEAVKAVLDYMQIRAQKKIRYFDDLYSHVGGGGDPLKFEVDYLKKNASETPWKPSPSAAAPQETAKPAPGAGSPPPASVAPPAPAAGPTIWDPGKQSMPVQTQDTRGTTTQQAPVTGAPVFDPSRRLPATAVPMTPSGEIDGSKIPIGQEFIVRGSVYRWDGKTFIEVGKAP